MPKERHKGEGSIEERGNGRFRATPAGRDPVTGRKHQSRTFNTRSEAERFINSFEAQQYDSKNHTLRSWLKCWLAGRQGKVAAGTYVFYEQRRPVSISILENDQLGGLADVRLDRFTKQHGERLILELRNAGKSIDIQRKTLVVLKAAMNAAADEGLIDKNPTARIQPPKKAFKPRRARWTAEEASRFLAASKVQAHRLYALFYLWLHTGIRKGEMFGLHWPEVRFEEGSLRIDRALEEVKGVQQLKEVKNGEERTVAVSEAVLDVLRHHRAQMRADGWDVKRGKVFPNDAGGWLWQSDFCKMFDRLQKHVDVPRITPYAMRHTHGSILARDGQSFKAIQTRLGHKDAGMTLKHYLEATTEEGVALANRSTALLASPEMSPAEMSPEMSPNALSGDPPPG